MDDRLKSTMEVAFVIQLCLINKWLLIDRYIRLINKYIKG